MAGLGAASLTPFVPREAWAQGVESADVVIVGAGLSGLNAALILEEIGIRTIVLEAKDRPGGRLYTLDDVPGAPEGGGSGIGGGYGRLLDVMDRFGIEREPARPRTEPVEGLTALNIKGQPILLADWPGHWLNPFPEGHNHKLPWEFQFGIFADYNPLSDPSEFAEPQFAKFDVAVFDFLRGEGFPADAIKLGSGTNASYGNSVHELSVLMWFHILSNARNMMSTAGTGAPYAAKGGNQRIPEAIANSLKTEIRFGKHVSGIRNESERVFVETTNGDRYSAKHAIVTVPFSALRLVRLDAPLSDLHRSAIDTLGYTNVTHLHFLPKRKFWEDDGLPPSMWTDGPTSRFMALRNNKDNPNEITSFIAFANGQVASLLDRLGPEDAAKYVLDYLAKIRPSTKGVLEFVKFWSWQLDPFAGGAYAAWKPGQISTFANDMIKPAGRIHFAGEHTAQVARGMEGAMESGERAAFEIFERI